MRCFFSITKSQIRTFFIPLDLMRRLGLFDRSCRRLTDLTGDHSSPSDSENAGVTDLLEYEASECSMYSDSEGNIGVFCPMPVSHRGFGIKLDKDGR